MRYVCHTAISVALPKKVIYGDVANFFISKTYCFFVSCTDYFFPFRTRFVMRAENYAPLHQNGTIVFLTRPVEELSSQGRPLSQSVGIQALYEKRLPLYEAWADARAACRENPKKTAASLAEAARLAREKTGGSK